MINERRKLSIKAIVFGTAVDVGGSFVVALVSVVAAGAILVAQGVPQDQLEARLQEDTGFVISSLVIGLAFSALGGFIAARVAKYRELAHGAATAVVALGLAVLTLAAAKTPPPWYEVLSYVLILPATLFGAHVAKRRNALPRQS